MSSISVAGDSSGSITIAAPAVSGSNTLTLPAVTDTLAGIAATQTLTNKTLGAGTIFPAGAVLQVVNGTYAVLTSNSTSTFADTGLTATITPKFNTSKILVLISHSCGKDPGNASSDIGLQLLRGASSISIFAISLGYTGTSSSMIFSSSYNYLDSPATTSATTYKTQFKNNDFNGASVSIQTSSAPSAITLMEIAG